MKFELPMQEGILLKRYKRFFADIEHKGEVITAHVANTGSLLGVLGHPQSPCRFTLSDDPNRKLKASLHMIKTPTSWVGINTQWPNRLVLEAFNEKLVPAWTEYANAKPEFKLNKESRLDMALFKKGDDPKDPSHYIEIKNVTLARDGVALFPDAVTERGLKHLEEMRKLCESGKTCEMVYVIQRTDCTKFGIADDIDPEYLKGLQRAIKAGLKVSAYPVKFDHDRVVLNAKGKLENYF